MILRCTKKLLAVIGPKLVTDPVPPPDGEDWHANLLWFGHNRQCPGQRRQHQPGRSEPMNSALPR